MVEGTPLLRVQTGNRLEGSNPFVSATFLNSISKSSRLDNGPAPHIRPVTPYLNRDDL